MESAETAKEGKERRRKTTGTYPLQQGQSVTKPASATEIGSSRVCQAALGEMQVVLLGEGVTGVGNCRFAPRQ